MPKNGWVGRQAHIQAGKQKLFYFKNRQPKIRRSVLSSVRLSSIDYTVISKVMKYFETSCFPTTINNNQKPCCSNTVNLQTWTTIHTKYNVVMWQSGPVSRYKIQYSLLVKWVMCLFCFMVRNHCGVYRRYITSP